MAKPKEFTVGDWEYLEGVKQERIRVAGSEIDALQLKRAEALIRGTEGDATAFADVQAADFSISQLKIEIEGIQELLKVIPGRKEFARSFDLDREADAIEKKASLLPDLVKGIDVAAEALVLAVKKYQDQREQLAKHGLQDPKFWAIDYEGAVSYFVVKHGTKSFMRWKREGKSASEAFNAHGGNTWFMYRSVVEMRVKVLRNHARRLRKEQGIENLPAYCPACHNLRIRYSEGVYRCEVCNSVVERGE